MKLSVAIAGKEAMPNAFVVFRGVKESIIKAHTLGYDVWNSPSSDRMR